ncbi:hypothetical protein FJ872_19655 [Mesorhizobium sp. B2-5-9]|uniref:hypothetical protein n=1 Tax=Mesorhizobium sp. B2-5-9 TaxID=2589921 RepID=UPI001126B707|nr:hypothetical protein [Mesorhizobium sp. B2-5-9]TPK15211.1 hypothetical protein FJ872_19655 [Mesorhizobium sp. B2-5-9]
MADALDLPSFRSTRRWWPASLFDEQMPAGRAQPQDWLKPDISGITIIRDEDDPEGGILATMLPGEIAEFVWHEKRGSAEILLMPDGSWSLDDARDDRTIDMFRPQQPLPSPEPQDLPPSVRIAAANWFAWEEDYETMMDTMDGFAKAFADLDPPDAEGSRMTVDMGYWSDGVKFRVSADGKSLEAVDG